MGNLTNIEDNNSAKKVNVCWAGLTIRHILGKVPRAYK